MSLALIVDLVDSVAETRRKLDVPQNKTQQLDHNTGRGAT
jgi:hypothetical protein